MYWTITETRRFEASSGFDSVAQVLIGKSRHLPDLVGAHSMLLQETCARIGSVGREVPIRIALVACGKRLGIRVPFNQQVVWQRSRVPAQES